MKDGVFANKRAQQLSTTAMVLLVLGVIILVVIAVAVANFYGFIGEKTEVLPGDLEAIAQSCEISASQNLVTSYCNEFKEVKIGGQTQFVNCDYAVRNLGAVVPSKGLLADQCKTTVAQARINFCNAQGASKEILVNGALCNVFTTDAELGETKKSCEEGGRNWFTSTTKPEDVSGCDLYFLKNAQYYCCAPSTP